MKLVLVSEFFYPYKTSTQKILTELAEDFVEYGLEVDVLTTKNAYREEKQELKKYEVYKGINIKRIFSTEGNRDSKVGRLLNYITFTSSVFFNLLFKKDYDKILFVSNPPLVPYIGYLIKKIRKKDYVYLVHDIYPDVAEKLGVIQNGSFISKVMNYMNNKIYKNAQKIIALGKDMKQVIVNKGISPDKIEIVTNWADSKVNFEKEVSREFYEKYNKELNSLITDVPIEEWLRKKKELEKKDGIIFLSDVLYKPEEWKKFDTWYENKNKTYIIELWETTADRNDGLGQVQIEKFKDLGQAIQRAKEIFETSDCVSIEVQSQDREKTYYFRDKINEKYFYVEENTKVEEEELNEPE